MVLFIIQGCVKYFDKNQYLKLYDFLQAGVWDSFAKNLADGMGKP